MPNDDCSCTDRQTGGRHSDASASCLSNDDGNEREARHTSERFKVRRAGIGLLSIVARRILRHYTRRSLSVVHDDRSSSESLCS